MRHFITAGSHVFNEDCSPALLDIRIGHTHFRADMGIGIGIDIGDNPACLSIILFNLNLVLANLISVLYNMDASEQYRSGQNSLDSEYMSAWQFCLPGILDI